MPLLKNGDILLAALRIYSEIFSAGSSLRDVWVLIRAPRSFLLPPSIPLLPSSTDPLPCLFSTCPRL